MSVLSKKLSYILRHNKNGHNIDHQGWALVTDMLDSLDISFNELEDIVKSDDKNRYSFNLDKTKIRANQGHSFKVDLGLKKIDPPFTLYHGTKDNLVDLILKEGLKPMSRVHVHLSLDIETAINVANRRKGNNVILEIKSRKMSNDGYPVFRSENGVYLTDFVPPEYISVK